MNYESSATLPKTPDLRANLGWLRIGLGIAAVGYVAVVAAQVSIMRGIRPMQYVDLLVALCSGVAYFTYRRWPRPSGLAVIGVIWCELTVTLVVTAKPEVTSMLVYPFLVLAVGLLLGESWGFGLAALTGLAIPLAVFGGGAFTASSRIRPRPSRR